MPEKNVGQSNYFMDDSIMKQPIALVTKKEIILREESDQWTVLVVPGTNEAFALNPVGSFILKQVDGQRTVTEIVEKIDRHFEIAMEDTLMLTMEFFSALIRHGLVGFEQAQRKRLCH